MKTIKLPEYDFKSLYPYTKTLSSSQVLKYIESPQDFYIEYVLGVKKPPSVAMMTGSIFSALHEDRKFPAREALTQIKAIKRIADQFENVIKRFPVVPSEVAMICKHKGWKFRATLDGYVHEQHADIENKTGQMEWTQRRVDESEQITFQSWCKWKRDGILFKKIILNWVDTRARAPKELVTFKTSRSVKQMQQFETLVDLVVEGIEAENWTQPIYYG